MHPQQCLRDRAGETRHVSVSIDGVTLDDERDKGELSRAADHRLYPAKRADRNRAIMQTPGQTGHESSLDRRFG